MLVVTNVVAGLQQQPLCGQGNCSFTWTLDHRRLFMRLECTVGDAFTEHVVVGKIFVAKKYLVTPSVFKLQKWFLHQNGVEFNQKSKSDLTKLWPLVGR